jgi:hypothetical protein
MVGRRGRFMGDGSSSTIHLPYIFAAAGTRYHYHSASSEPLSALEVGSLCILMFDLSYGS